MKKYTLACALYLLTAVITPVRAMDEPAQADASHHLGAYLLSVQRAEKPMQLEIIDIDDPTKNDVLTTPMANAIFPLNEEDIRFIEALKSKVTELGAAGLAAPQVGAAKPIIAYQVPEAALQLREDVTDLVPLTVLINPSYEPIESEGRSLDWEGCFSGKNHYGKVWRWRAILYKGQDVNGNPIEGKAVGFLSRLFQHETDHCHHKICIHSYDPNSPQGAPDDLMPVRKEEIRQKKETLGLGPDDPFPFLEIN